MVEAGRTVGSRFKGAELVARDDIIYDVAGGVGSTAGAVVRATGCGDWDAGSESRAE